jgi:polyhydroxybutyrate depolymerase
MIIDPAAGAHKRAPRPVAAEPSPAMPDPAPLPPGDHALTLRAGLLVRRYLLHVPKGGAGPRPAVLMLHGAGGTGAWTRDETGWNATADREGFAVAYPDGVAPDPAHPPGFLANPQVWNAGAGPGLALARGADDVGFLRAVLDDLPRRTPVDPRRVYVAGFSNGAAMAFRLAAELSERIAAVAPVAGYCPAVAPPARPVPTVYVVGADDPLVPLEGGEVRSPWGGHVERRPPVGETLARWAELLGLPPDPVAEAEEDGVTVVEYGPGVEFFGAVVAGLGHHWPGGRGRLNPRIAGRPSDRVRANELIWEFFQKHALEPKTP